jgi:hypothetical protein
MVGWWLVTWLAWTLMNSLLVGNPGHIILSSTSLYLRSRIATDAQIYTGDFCGPNTYHWVYSVQQRNLSVGIWWHPWSTSPRDPGPGKLANWKSTPHRSLAYSLKMYSMRASTWRKAAADQEAKKVEGWPNMTSAWAGWSRFDIPVGRYGGIHSLLICTSSPLGSPTCH